MAGISKMNLGAKASSGKPVWTIVTPVGNTTVWEIRLFDDKLLGVYKAHAAWVEDQQVGSLSLVRDSNFVCTLPVKETDYTDVDSFRRAAWAVLTNELSSAITALQTQLTTMMQGYPEVK